MKRAALLIVLALPAAHAVSPVGLLPEDKVAIVVPDTERNPFGKKVEKAEVAEVENEEAHVRAAIEKFSVRGITQSRAGVKVLLGPLVLEAGRNLPPVIPKQSEKLRVLSVSEDKAEIAFVETDGSAGLRKIFITLNIKPKIQFRVAKPSEKAAAEFDGAVTKDEFGATQ